MDWKVIEEHERKENTHKKTKHGEDTYESTQC